MTTIYLIRHAEAEGNLYRRIHGWYNALVTENGFRQIAALEKRFRDISVDAVWSSDLYRTQTTARSVYVPKRLQLHTDPQLREVHMGVWEDQTWGQARHFDLERMLQFNNSDPAWRVPGGESLGEVGERVAQALVRIARQHPNQTVAVFCHGTAIRQALAQIKGVSPQDWHAMPHSENTAVSRLIWDGSAFHIDYEMDASHLPAEISTLGRQSWWRRDRKVEDINLWFRPIRWEEEQALYLEARRETWTSSHGSGIPFDALHVLFSAREHLSRSPWGITVAMAGDTPAGLLQLDDRQYQEEGAGFISFCCLLPERREQSLGIQLIGQAVSFFRPLGRDKLRLACPPDNYRAQHFYAKYGFVKVGQVSDSGARLDILEKYIGYER